MSQLIPKGRVIEVSINVVVPETVTPEELDDWLNHNLVGSGGIHQDNPLYPVEPEGDLDWTDTGCYRHTEVSGVRFEGDSTYYRCQKRDVRDERDDVQVGRWEGEETIKKRAIAEARSDLEAEAT
ncbi:MAG: hypothetical protein AAFX90_10265 [Pseudomonadota bacterium]